MSLEDNSSQITPLNIGGLDFHESHPDTYTLLKLDASRVCFVEPNPWAIHEDLKEIGPNFLKKRLVSKKGPRIMKGSAARSISAQDQMKQLVYAKKFVKTSNGERRDYYLISVYQKQLNLKSINLIKSLNKSEDGADNDELSRVEDFEDNDLPGFACSASIVLFPSPKRNREAMVYGFGNWKMLIEPSCIVPKWGLTVFASECEPEKIKDVKSTFYRTSNTSTQTASVQKPTRIENFGLEVSSQGLDSLRGGFKKTYNFTHLVKAKDFLQFSVKCERSQDNEKDMTIISLETIATYFRTLTESEGFKIHERMQELIDQEVKDIAIINELQRKIDSLFYSESGKDIFFADPSIWVVVGGKRCKFGFSREATPLDALRLKPQRIENRGSSPTPISEAKIEVFRKKGDEKYAEIEILPFLSSNPIEYQNNFYRLERGKWFFVKTSRFESIINILRQRKISASLLGLPSYDVEDIKAANKSEYKELVYNKKAVKSLFRNALLLDRENIRLDKNSKNIFEFCDIILKKNGMIEIIHVKRFSAGQLSHCREQVERTGDFLATEFDKKSVTDFFFKKIFSNFERKAGLLRTTGQIFQSFGFKKEDTGSDIFSEMLLSTDDKNKNFKDLVKKLQKVFSNDNYNLFINNREKFMRFFDRLLDFYDIFQENIKEEALEFLEYFKLAVDLQETLFYNGPLKSQNLEKINIVLAMIDDRKTEKASGAEKKTRDKPKNSKASSNLEKSKNQSDFTEDFKLPLFKKQDLWGLDKTRTSIEKQGFGFRIIVINEEKTENFDAFGEIVKQKTNHYYQKEDEDERNPTIEIEITRTEEDQNEVVFSPTPHFSSVQLQKSLKEYFETATANYINTQEIQKIEYTDKLDQEEGLYSEYITCPTKGDGDCFFHAVFTDSGECTEKVQNRAADMRNVFVDMITTGLFRSHMGHLLYEHFSELHSTDQKALIPPDTLQKFDANSEFQELQARFRQGRPKLENHLPPEFFQEFDRKFVYSEEQIKEKFLQQDINKFIEPLRKVGGANTFIPVRKDMKCPAEIIAEENNANINVFTFNQTKQSLDLYKSIRGPDEGQITNVLIEGNHFIRLLGQNDSDDQLRQAIQIIKNSGVEEFEKTLWTEMDTSKRNYNEALVDQVDEDPSIMKNGEPSKRKKLKTINSEVFKKEELFLTREGDIEK